jgi:hypothetical protein
MNVSLLAPSATPSHQLDKSAIDQRDSRICPEPEAIGHAGSDRKNVFDGAADFNADNVVRGVCAKLVARQRHGKVLGEVVIVCGDGHRRGQAGADLLGKRRTGEHRHRTLGAEHLGRHPVWQLAGMQLETLGCPAHAGS